MDRALRAACALVGTLTLGLSLSSSGLAQNAEQDVANANRGIQTEIGRDAAWQYDQHRKLSASIDALKPQRAGVVDAYVIVAGLDSDPVFGREAAETAKVLARRYDAVGRTILLAAGPGAADRTVPHGSPASLAIALGAVSARMDVKEDVLILYTTSHGAPQAGLSYRDGNQGLGWIGPRRLADLLNGVGIAKRMVLISACFSGELLPPLINDTTVIVTAADRTQTSFGCAPGNDWTFFGDALINNAMRKPLSLDTAVAQSFDLIRSWEMANRLTSSLPQLYIGSGVRAWLDPLEKRMPPSATQRVGRPAADD